MRRVEVAACEEMDGPTEADLAAIRAATFTVEAINEREKVTDHDTAAFVDVLSESAGPAGRWIHYGLTSSDVLDTGLALQIKRVAALVLPDAHRLAAALAAKAREHVDTLCVGRTHGIHAEPTTFGIKLAGFAFEAHRNAQRLERAFAQASVGAVSGAVGTYSATSPEFEARVLARLGLEREPVSTQVVARDRHAELLQTIALAGAGLERFSHRSAPPGAHRGGRGPRAVRPRAEGLQRHAAQAQPDQVRAGHGPGPRAARQRLRGGGGRGPVARARHLPLVRGADHPARLHDPARPHAAAGAGAGGGDGRGRRAHAREPGAHLRRAVLPAGPAGAGGGRQHA